MEEIVLIMDHHSHAHVRLDIVVIAAKVNIIFKIIVHLFFYFFPFLCQKEFCGIERKLLLNLRGEGLFPKLGNSLNLKYALEFHHNG
jgi:hypothetical protein